MRALVKYIPIYINILIYMFKILKGIKLYFKITEKINPVYYINLLALIELFS